MDSKQITILLQFDFSKAFDTISPARLLQCMGGLGFSGSVLRWTRAYLCGREQIVVADRTERSSWLPTMLGVPQGSVLGPLFFCLYINDLGLSLNSMGVRHILYADDLQVYLSVPKDGLKAGAECVAAAARAVLDWAAAASLKLNLGKTSAMLFGTRRFLSDIETSGFNSIALGDGTVVPFSPTVKSLGVVLDGGLTWRPNIENVCRKSNRVLYSLRFFRQYTTESLRALLARSLVFPHLDYCSVVYLDASQELRVRLERVRNSCVRYVTGARWDDHITPHRKRLGWVRVDSSRQYHLLLLMYKILRLGVPSYLADLFSPNNTSRPVRGNPKELVVPKMDKEKGEQSLRVQGALLWNNLPAAIREVPSLLGFKRALNKYIRDLD